MHPLQPNPSDRVTWRAFRMVAVAVVCLWTGGLSRGTTAVRAQAPPPGPAAALTPPSPAFQDKFITTGEGLRIHYLEWGTAGKRPFIMLHGINRSGHTFDHLAPLLRRDYHVIAMDLRGHGDSDWSPKGAYLAEDFARDLHSLVEQLDLRDVVLTGNSMGGRVVQVYAGLHPDRTGKVIVEDVGPERPDTVTRTLTQRIQGDTEGWASEEDLLKSMRRGQTRVSEATHRNWIRYETRKLPNGRIAWKYDPNVTQGLGPVDLWPYIRKFKAPVLYMVGANSNLVPKDIQAQLEAALPNIEVVTIPDAGHYPHLDAPAVWLAVVKAFLAG
jgi:pimeloyl-ACP methyl ester carboxylesterase